VGNLPTLFVNNSIDLVPRQEPTVRSSVVLTFEAGSWICSSTDNSVLHAQ
jgi:hypothetical protein